MENIKAGAWVKVRDYSGNTSIKRYKPQRQDFAEGYYKEVMAWKPTNDEWCVVANEGVMAGTYTVFQYDEDYGVGYEIMPLSFLRILEER